MRSSTSSTFPVNPTHHHATRSCLLAHMQLRHRLRSSVAYADVSDSPVFHLSVLRRMSRGRRPTRRQRTPTRPTTGSSRVDCRATLRLRSGKRRTASVSAAGAHPSPQALTAPSITSDTFHHRPLRPRRPSSSILSPFSLNASSLLHASPILSRLQHSSAQQSTTLSAHLCHSHIRGVSSQLTQSSLLVVFCSPPPARTL